MKFKECEELLNSKRLSLKIKGMVYWSFVRLSMLYGSETWCLGENEMTILRRTERAMCAAKLIEKRGPNEDVRIEGNSGLDGEGEWSEIVWAFVEEG